LDSAFSFQNNITDNIAKYNLVEKAEVAKLTVHSSSYYELHSLFFWGKTYLLLYGLQFYNVRVTIELVAFMIKLNCYLGKICMESTYGIETR